MPRREERWYFLIGRKWLEDYCRVHGVAPLLDMLRYDGAVVEGNSPDRFFMFSVPHKPTVERWNSFGIRTSGPWPSTTGIPYELQKYAVSVESLPEYLPKPPDALPVRPEHLA